MINRWLSWLPFLLAGLYIALIGTPWENTYSLAADGRLDLKIAWFYRFRDAALLEGFGVSTVFADLALAIMHVTGSRLFWIALCFVMGALSLAQPRLLRLLMLLPLIAALAYGEAFMLWCLALALVANILQRISLWRKTKPSLLRRMTWIALTLATIVILSGLILALANPRYAVTRQKVLAGKSLTDRMQVFTGVQRISEPGGCLAVLNPDDLRGVNATEQLTLASLRGFSGIRLLDLKVVERNYALLNLRTETGTYMFSDAARAYAAAEKLYAATQLNDILSAPSVCLIAAFDVSPDKEENPYSRARVMLDLRKKAKRETRLIQLSGR